jgi:hypothetical protein
VVLRGFGDLKGRKREEETKEKRRVTIEFEKAWINHYRKLNSTIERRRKRIVDRLI